MEDTLDNLQQESLFWIDLYDSVKSSSPLGPVHFGPVQSGVL